MAIILRRTRVVGKAVRELSLSIGVALQESSMASTDTTLELTSTSMALRSPEVWGVLTIDYYNVAPLIGAILLG